MTCAIMVDSKIITHTSRNEKWILWKACDVLAQYLNANFGYGEVTDEDVPGRGTEEVEERGDQGSFAAEMKRSAAQNLS